MDRAEVRTTVEEVRRVGVTKGVRRHRPTIDAGLLDPAREATADVRGREAPTGPREEEGPGGSVGDHPLASTLQPSDRREECRLPDGHGPNLVALAAHAERLAVDVEVADIETDDLLGTEAASIGEFEHRAVAETEDAGVAGACRVEEATSVRRGEHTRKMVAPARRSEAISRTRVDPAVFAKGRVERADRGHAARDRGGRQAALREPGDVAPQFDERGGLRVQITRDRPVREVSEIGGVGAPRAWREPAACEVGVEEGRRGRPRVARGGRAGSLGVMGAFYIHVKEGTIATFQQLVESEVIEPGDDPQLPWRKIDAPSDASTLWYAALRKQERGIFLGTLTFRHCDHHSLLLETGWEEVPVDEIGVDED